MEMGLGAYPRIRLGIGIGIGIFISNAKYESVSSILQQPGQRTMKSKNLRYNPVRIVRKDYCCSWSWPGSAEHWKTLRLSNNAKTARSAKTTRLIFKNIAKNVQTFKSQIFHGKRNTEKKDY